MRDAWRELRTRIDVLLNGDEVDRPVDVDYDEATGDLLVTGKYDGVRRTHRITITEVPPDADRCPACRHPWEDHADDGCQAPVTVDRTGPYDCNCTERKP